MGEPLVMDSFLAVLLSSGNTERQMSAITQIVDITEKEVGALHLQIHAMRAMAHTMGDESFAKFADAVLHASSSLLTGLREQHASLSRILGQKREERLAAS